MKENEKIFKKDKGNFKTAYYLDSNNVNRLWEARN